MSFVKRIGKRKQNNGKGDAFVWIAAGSVALTVIMVVGIIALVMVKGLGYFWPASVHEMQMADGTKVWGQISEREVIPETDPLENRVLLKVGNRELSGQDFRWVDERDVAQRQLPKGAAVVERLEWGVFIGALTKVVSNTTTVEGPDAWPMLSSKLPQVAANREQVAGLIRKEHLTTKEKERLELLQGDLDSIVAVFATAEGLQVEIPVSHMVRVYRPNDMNLVQKVGLYLMRFWEFVSGQPRESNTEGGILPALFGTVIMVLIMTLAVVPLGILAAVYLREYAGDNAFVSAVRIGVNNLAGVPSIVFGVFGLAFFVYSVGGTIDSLFFADSLPTPTFGTGGVLWASLTLALLTLPVVIVSTEEGLAAVPSSTRQASYALGATKLETVLFVVLPQALPGIITGMILAMGRAAGEVAPLMLTGVVKLAAAPPVDLTAPFVHLERKFMHLGFHIYDLGFQAPNVEAARPMVFATTLALVAVVLSLNLIGIVVRNRLRKRFSSI